MKPFDSSGAFAPTVPEGGDALRRLAVRGAGATVLFGAAGLAVQVVGTVVLARLIGPRDYGLVTMVTTFSILLVSCGGSSGVPDAVAQCERIDHTLASNLFWITLGIGVLLTAGFASAGWLLAMFYGEAALVTLAAGLSLTIVLTSLSVMHLALLRRAMLFSTVARIDLAAKAVSVIVSIAFARAGWGRWALVMGACALPLSTIVGAWWKCRWLPGGLCYTPETGKLLKVAVHTYGRFSVKYFSSNTDNLLVGWRFGAFALGFYKRAYDLFALSATQLVSTTSLVAVSALSRVRGDRAQFHRYLLGSIAVLAFLGMGIAGDLTLIGKDLIRLLLGPGWEPAGQIFTFFAPGIGMMLIYGTHGWIHLSIGRADRWFWWGIVEWVVTTLLFFGGLPWGPQGIAVAWDLSFWILTIPAMWYAGKPIGLEIAPVLGAIWRYITASLLAGLACSLLLARMPRLAEMAGASGAALRIAVFSASFTLLYLLAIVALHRSLAPLQSVVDLLKELASINKRPLTAGEADAR
jgi:PST family polysaccharide transporter